MTGLKELRLTAALTQKQAAELIGVSLRSYKSYENDIAKENSIKYRYMMDIIGRYARIDEEHGILSIDCIKNVCKEVFSEYNVDYCILFGSYAKGNARENSDVDLLISTDTQGLRFYGIAEKLRNALNKKVDLLDSDQLNNNPELLDEILKYGVRVFVNNNYKR